MKVILILGGLVLGAWIGESIEAAALGVLLALVASLLPLQSEVRRLRDILEETHSHYREALAKLSDRIRVLEETAQNAQGDVEPEREVQTDAADLAEHSETEAPKLESHSEPLKAANDAPPQPRPDIVTAPPSTDTAVFGETADESMQAGSETSYENVTLSSAAKASLERRHDGAQTTTYNNEVAVPLLERAFVRARDWLLGGNTVLRVGAVLLFLGLAFLLRYASERVVVAIEYRYIGVTLSALALLGLGWWLRERKPNYALIVQGTGVAILYLTVFAAMRLHPLLSAQVAFSLLVGITAFSAVLAVAQNSLSMATAAALGGFSAPILASTGSGNHVALFSYFVLLNTGIFAIAWFKAWRLLNLIGVIGTFGIGLTWGLRSYEPSLYASTQPFLIVFFLMYVAIGLLFARRKLLDARGFDEDVSRDEVLRWSVRQTDYVDGSVLLGAPIVGFGLQYGVVQHIEFGAAFSALAMGLFYLLLARWLSARVADRAMLLVETCLALGVVFGTLAIPLAFDADWTSAAWAVEGAGLYWLGVRQQRIVARVFALLLQAGAALAYLSTLQFGQDTLLQGSTLGALMVGAALLFSHDLLRRRGADQSPPWEYALLPALATGGLAFVYLIPPLSFGTQGTQIGWALAGLATLLAGLKIGSTVFLYAAFAIQFLAGVVFAAGIQINPDSTASVLKSGSGGMLSALLVGFSMIAGMVLAVNQQLVLGNRHLRSGLGAVLLVGLLIVNLAVLFALPWRTATAVWGGSGLLIIWLGLALQHRPSFLFGLALEAVAGVAFLSDSAIHDLSFSTTGLSPLAHAGFWTPVVLALAALVGSLRLYRASVRDCGATLGTLDLEKLSWLMLLWGVAWWGFATVTEILRFAPSALHHALILMATAASVVLAAWFAPRLRWPGLAVASLVQLPIAIASIAVYWHLLYQPFADLGWAGWAAVVLAHFWSLYRLESILPRSLLAWSHVIGVWLILAVLALQLRYAFYALAEQYNAWRWLGWALVPSIYLAAAATQRPLPWPVSTWPREYRAIAALPVAVLLLGWFWLVNLISDASAEPLPYVPVLNPLELGMLLVLAAVVRWVPTGFGHNESSMPITRRWLEVAVGASLFALATMAVLRSAYHWGGVAFDSQSLLTSMRVQAGLSIVWTLIALGLMIAGHLRTRRDVWVVGATLIAIVVVKLFFVELGNSGGLERIVSFIGVGVLLLIIGYFAPLPPRLADSDDAQEQSNTENTQA